MRRFLILFILCAPFFGFAQTVFGIIVDEDNNPLPATLVFNAKTQEKVNTNLNGEFTIEAAQNEELRFIRQGFERRSKTIMQSDFATRLTVILTRNTEEIEEVKIARQPTGNLKTDARNYGDTKAVATLKAETSKYLHAKSSPEILAPKPGEFVQPVGPGFSVGTVKNHWDDIDFMQFLTKELGEEFFVSELKLNVTEIQPFIFYIFRNFDRKSALFTGNPTSSDLSRFITESYKKLDSYRKNLPNDPPRKKKRNKFLR